MSISPRPDSSLEHLTADSTWDLDETQPDTSKISTLSNVHLDQNHKDTSPFLCTSAQIATADFLDDIPWDGDFVKTNTDSLSTGLHSEFRLDTSSSKGCSHHDVLDTKYPLDSEHSLEPLDLSLSIGSSPSLPSLLSHLDESSHHLPEERKDLSRPEKSIQSPKCQTESPVLSTTRMSIEATNRYLIPTIGLQLTESTSQSPLNLKLIYSIVSTTSARALSETSVKSSPISSTVSIPRDEARSNKRSVSASKVMDRGEPLLKVPRIDEDDDDDDDDEEDDDDEKCSENIVSKRNLERPIPYRYILILKQIRIMKRWMRQIFGIDTMPIDPDETTPLPGRNVPKKQRSAYFSTRLQKQMIVWCRDAAAWENGSMQPNFFFILELLNFLKTILDRVTLKELLTFGERLRLLVNRQTFIMQIVMTEIRAGKSLKEVYELLSDTVCRLQIPVDKFCEASVPLFPKSLLHTRWEAIESATLLSIELADALGFTTFMEIDLIIDENTLFSILNPLLERLSHCVLTMYRVGFLANYEQTVEKWKLFNSAWEFHSDQDSAKKKFAIVIFETWLILAYYVQLTRVNPTVNDVFKFKAAHYDKLLCDWNVQHDSTASVHVLRDLFLRHYEILHRVPIYHFYGFTFASRIKWKYAQTED